ncbi:NAD(P)-dependent dehydrogenase (short-subunit alcohol dehydrogenase family) [Vibrio sp. ES.051]|uniref:SDR family NAD(P)-dependent oxidoreductase n=1 Tax=Vibrio sp. ES.051 TaxID=1761909 RepID=UPI000BF2FBB0|nr:SDR family NAD(P)-dependent oxidoreductase [Vibrio sp. ES.051]PFG56296.1 NAD(P)-dependent dehydrogenase (short-subunit alcohol dehydrogenase family) [Vibrio sp. ES.051]
MTTLNNKVALILAGADGIGKACSLNLAQSGATVFVADWDKKLAEQTVQEINRRGGTAYSLFFNAFDNTTYPPMIEQVINQEGKIDILVNNFGGVDLKKDRDLAHTETEDWEKNMLANINSVFIPVKCVVPHMVKSGAGSIVNISSLSSLSAEMSSISYGTAKNAINHMTRQIAIQYAKYNIRCNAVLPGMIATNAVKENLNDEFIDNFLSTQPIKRMGKPEDIAHAVNFLASDAASFITGVCLSVTGGMDIAPARYYFDEDKVSF